MANASARTNMKPQRYPSWVISQMCLRGKSTRHEDIAAASVRVQPLNGRSRPHYERQDFAETGHRGLPDCEHAPGATPSWRQFEREPDLTVGLRVVSEANEIAS